jgi:hypothetical protein
VTPWLRTTGLLLVLGTGAVVSPCGGAPAYGVVVGSGRTGGGRVAVTAPASGSLSTSDSASSLRPASGPDAAHASPEPSRAGSHAGEGRQRPGRTAEPTADEDEDEGGGGVGDDTAGLTADGDDDGSPSAGPASPAPADSASSQEAAPVPSSPPLRPLRQTVTHAEGTAEPVLRILPLGTGLILIGLGLGLAFIALRVRRS